MTALRRRAVAGLRISRRVHRRPHVDLDGHPELQQVGARVVAVEPLGPPDRQRHQRDLGLVSHPDRAGLERLGLERAAHRRLGEHPDRLAGAQCVDRVLVAGRPRDPVHRDVLHPPHQRPGDRIAEHRLLGHEPDQPARGSRGEPDEDEVQVAHVVAGQDDAGVLRDVLRTVDADLHPQRCERGVTDDQDGRVDQLCHPVSVGASTRRCRPAYRPPARPGPPGPPARRGPDPQRSGWCSSVTYSASGVTRGSLW